MIITKQVKVTVLSVIMAMVLVASFSSFMKGDPVKLKAKKVGVVKAKYAESTSLKNNLVYQIYYWDGSGWVNGPQTDCWGNGAICSVGFSPTGTDRMVPDICNDAVAAYMGTGNLSNPSVNTGTVTVRKKVFDNGTTILCTVTEKASD